jgi:Flp pilus assembly protein TadG
MARDLGRGVLARRRMGDRRMGDRGSVSLWVVIFAFTTIALLILVVDGGQVMNAKSRAADVAEQAARAAAGDRNVTSLRTGSEATLAGDACSGPAANLVTAYAKGIPGVTAKMTSCQQTAAQPVTVTVTVQLSATPAIPVGVFSAISETATESAYVVCGNADQAVVC